jgi:hypothetical protein
VGCNLLCNHGLCNLSLSGKQVILVHTKGAYQFAAYSFLALTKALTTSLIPSAHSPHQSRFFKLTLINVALRNTL